MCIECLAIKHGLPENPKLKSMIFLAMNLYLVRRFPSLRCVRTPLWPWCLIRCPNREYLLNGCQMVRNWGVKHVKIHIYIYYYYYNIYIYIYIHI